MVHSLPLRSQSYLRLVALTVLVCGHFALTSPAFAASAQTQQQDVGVEDLLVYEGKSQMARASQKRSLQDLDLDALRKLCDQKQDRLGAHHRAGLLRQPKRALRFQAPSTRRALPRPQTDTAIEILQNVGLGDNATMDVTSTVCEPSLAVRGQEILYTGNWFAAFSTDGGQTFQYRDPDSTFPDPPPLGAGFCCDQIAIYDPVHDAMFWLLQYIDDGSGNALRVAVASGADIVTENWRYYDFTPESVGEWTNEWFDYPDLALSDDHLFVTSNVFSTVTNRFTRSVVLRIPLAQISQYQSLSYSYFHSSEYFSFRPTQGADDTMYFAAHADQETLRVYTWEENATSLDVDEVAVDPWSTNFAVAPGPDGRDWVGRVDQRITAAWFAPGSGGGSGEIGFAWTSSQDGFYDYPHVRVAVLDADTRQVKSEPHLWSDQVAYAYPAAAVNADGRVGLSVCFGGNQDHPGMAVGVLEADGSWNLTEVGVGSDGPLDNKWGDYLAVRVDGQDPSEWVATGFALDGGGDRRDVVPRMVRFGVGAVTDPGPTGGGVDLGPALQTLGELEAQVDGLRSQLDALESKLAELRQELESAGDGD